eukprot:jgi/Mesvir1/19909/Mv13181-RA.1
MSDVGWREKYANIVKGVKGFLGQVSPGKHADILQAAMAAAGSAEPEPAVPAAAIATADANAAAQAGKEAFTPHEPLPSPMKRKRTKHIFRSNDEKVKLVDDLIVAVKDSMQERGFLTKWCAEKDVHPNTVRGWLKNPARVHQMKTGKKTAKAVPRMVEGKTAQ